MKDQVPARIFLIRVNAAFLSPVERLTKIIGQLPGFLNAKYRPAGQVVINYFASAFSIGYESIYGR